MSLRLSTIIIIFPFILGYQAEVYSRVGVAIWITAGLAPMYDIQGNFLVPNILFGAGLAISMTVNALVTGLIVFRLSKVFLEVRAASNERILGATSGDTLRAIIFILIESGLALFSIQFVRLVFLLVYRNKSRCLGCALITRTHEMLNVIIQLGHFYFYFILLIM